MQEKENRKRIHVRQASQNLLTDLMDITKPKSALRLYGVAVILVLLTFLVRYVFNLVTAPPEPSRTAFVSYFLAIIFAAIYGGFGAGVLSTVFSAIMINFISLPPYTVNGVNDWGDVVIIVLFCLNGLVISLICGWLRNELARRTTLAEQNAALYEEAQAALEDRNEFLSVAAHELKTPVTAMRGFAQLLLRQINRQGTLDLAQTQKALVRIDEQSVKLANLISRLLDVSRLEAGKLTLELEQADLAAIVESVVATYQATDATHRWELNLPPALNCIIDPIRFEQVVINLVDNAVKYSPNGQAIKLNLTTVEDKLVCLSVKDEGVGIAPALRDKIFDRFFQARQQDHTGLGLGLYISYQIVSLHDGTIEVQFPPEGGSCFIVSIPFKTMPTLSPQN